MAVFKGLQLFFFFCFVFSQHLSQCTQKSFTMSFMFQDSYCCGETTVLLHKIQPIILISCVLFVFLCVLSSRVVYHSEFNFNVKFSFHSSSVKWCRSLFHKCLLQTIIRRHLVLDAGTGVFTA